jgi:hypothetical protein
MKERRFPYFECSRSVGVRLDLEERLTVAVNEEFEGMKSEPRKNAGEEYW